MTKYNPLLDVDSYKSSSHFLQYPPGATNISSYICARGPKGEEVVNFGLQMWLLDKINGYIVKMDDVIEADTITRAHSGSFNHDEWMKIVGEPLPLRIQALPEGMVVPTGTPMVQMANVNRKGVKMPWQTSYWETSALRAVWYPTTVATNSRKIKKLIKKYLEKSADNCDGLSFKLHDFGFRGVSSYESGCIGGLAHLVNFMGSDTLGASLYGQRFYFEKTPAFSIPAAEHSTITSWGRENEEEAYANMVKCFGGDGRIYAVVSDSYDIYNAVSHIWGEKLKSLVKMKGGTLVVRPDSGRPADVVLDVVRALGSKFGHTINSRGYKVLDPCVRVIQGDGINYDSIESICRALVDSGWSTDNVAFGMGGALLQDVTRDDYQFAMKGSAVSYDEGRTWTGFSKDPVTDTKKKSLSGRLAVIKRGDEIVTIQESELGDEENLLQDVWVNGDWKIKTTLAEIRARVAI